MDNELVILKRKRTLTTSLVVAEKFRKRHDNVVQKIENLMADDEKGLLNFKESDYINPRGKTYPMYEMDRKSFSILVMSFTGKKAFEWKMKFYDAFEAMELAILEHKNREWEASRLEGKQVRRELTDEIQSFIEYAEEQGSRNGKLYYMNITKMTNQALFLIGRKAPQGFRNMLDQMQISFLQTAEFVARNALREGMDADMFYKDIYVHARDKVTAFAATVGQTPVIGVSDMPLLEMRQAAL